MAIQVLFQHNLFSFRPMATWYHSSPQRSGPLIAGGINPLKYDTAEFLFNPDEKEDIVTVSVPHFIKEVSRILPHLVPLPIFLWMTQKYRHPAMQWRYRFYSNIVFSSSWVMVT